MLPKFPRGPSVLVLLVTFAIIFHYPLIVSDSLLLRDDLTLVTAVSSVTSFEDYLAKLFAGRLLDFQPLRDLTLLFNIWLKNHWGYGGFHLTNLLLGGLILYQLRRFLGTYAKHNLSALVIIIIIGFHPLFHSSLAWVSNRKHLLSLFFMLLFLNDWRETNRITWRGVLWTILGALSQPITIFIPPMIAVSEFVKHRKVRGPAIVISLTSFSGFLGHYLFYKSHSPSVGMAGLLDENWLLWIGRMFAQIYVPVSFAALYDPGNPLALIGLTIFCALLVILLRKRRNDSVLLGAALIASTWYPVLLWGVRDAYLLCTLFGCISLSVLALESQFSKIIPMLTILLLPLSYQSFRAARMWESDLKLMQTSYEGEGGPENLQKYAASLAIFNPTRAYLYYARLVQFYPDYAHHDIAPSLARAYYLSSHISPPQKLAEYMTVNQGDAFFYFYKYKFLKEQGQEQAARFAAQDFKRELTSKPILREIMMRKVCVEYMRECEELEVTNPYQHK